MCYDNTQLALVYEKTAVETAYKKLLAFRSLMLGCAHEGEYYGNNHNMTK